MSFDIPTPMAIQQRIEAESSLALGSQHAALAGTAENMVARITTIVAFELYGFIAQIALQILPPSAAAEFLERHGTFWLDEGRKEASKATGPVVVTGSAGVVIPAGAILKRPDNTAYQFVEDVTIGGGGTGTGTVIALNAGLAGNTPAAITLNLTAPIIGVSSTVVGTAGLTGGADVESDYDLLGRITDRVQNPPHGGALHDYEAWAKEVAGVTRAWAKQGSDGVMTVDVTFVMDNKPDTIVPSLVEIGSVFDHIESVRPVGSRPNVFAPTLQTVNFSIALNPNTVAVQQAIQAELEDFFNREGTAKGQTLYLSRLSEAVSVGAGEHHHQLITPAANVVVPFGSLPVLGTIAWSAG